MKTIKFKHLILAVFFISSAVITAAAQQAGFTIKGKINGLPDTAVVELIPSATHKNEKPVASAKVTHGEFVLKGAAREPRLYHLIVAGSSGYLELVTAGEKISLEGTVKKQQSGNMTSYDFSGVTVKGSPLTDQYLKKTAYRSELDKEYEAYYKNNEAVSAAMSKAHAAKDTAAIDSISKSAAWAKLSREESEFFKTVEDKIKGSILADKDSWWGPLMMMSQLSYFTDKEKPLYEAFSKNAKESFYGKLLQKELYPPTLEGKKAPAFTLQNEKSEKSDLRAFTAGKKYVLLDFWASWCGPCRKSIPGLKALYEKYAPQGLQIVSISIDKNKADWLKAVDEEKLPWPSFLDRQSVADAFNVKAIPSLFLIDSSGKVVKSFTGAAGVKEQLDRMF